ncbi:L-lactate permease [Pseudotabrizicola sp.]|uniref:L-lactate permease n=1 Tax=Pseudotabrizicola sp. TaxID=2939647 RepID=UPI00271CE9A7|nr:L-lactate permease [Pseudotabrizicola sp.]MDO8883337.1 L-lactate permease [Pseudotabrizicola sp.]
MPTALAALPIVVVVLTMALLHWRAALAGAVGLCVALAVILGGNGLSGGAVMVAGVAAEAASSTLTILWIILPALVIYEVQSQSGTLERIRLALTRLSDDRAVQALLIAWFFGLFMEGAAGFGAPVALAAPLLVGLGFTPVRAVTLALLGHAAGVSFGAVGTPALAQIGLLGLPGSQLAALTMMVHALPLCVLSLWVMRLATDVPLTRRHVGIALLAALCFLLPALLLAGLAGPELPTLGGALAGGAIFAVVMRSLHLKRIDEGKWRLSDLAPYLLIVALVLLTRLLPPVQVALSSLWLGWEWLGYSGGFAPFYHPGTMLAAGLVAGALLTGRGALLGPALGAALRRLAPVALALLVMLALARLMVHGGLIAQLAGAASQAGALWPLLSPFIGMLGTFVSGSATASNILFTDFQAATARALDLPVVLMAAAQGVGAAIGNAIAPHNIIAGAATVGLSGRDGEVLARTLIPVLTYTTFVGIIVFIASRQF